MVRHLPADSAVHRVVLGPDVEWRLEHQLLASLLDQLVVLDHHYLTVHSKTKPAAPRRLPRPGVIPADDPNRIGRTDRLASEVRSYLDRFAPQHPEEVVDQ